MEQCSYDWVRLYDPSTALFKGGSSMKTVGESMLIILAFSVFIILGPYCSFSQTPINIEYRTPIVYVFFKSDHAKNGRGFALRFTANDDPPIVPTTISPITTTPPAQTSHSGASTAARPSERKLPARRSYYLLAMRL